MNLLITILSLLLSGIFGLGGMTHTSFNNDDDDAYRSELPNLWERTPSYAPTPGYPDREWTPSVICPSPVPEDIISKCSPSLHQHISHEQRFDPVVECADGSAWDEQSSDCIHYQIEWRVKLNSRVVVKDTKQDLIQPPRSYWEQMKEDACNIIGRKTARGRRVRLDDTDMVLSVNSQRNIDKHFEEDREPLPSRTDKRGKSSVTTRMLADRDAQIDAEQVTGQYSVWRDVYRVMRCPGPPCRHEGQYCWQDPEGKRHHRVKTHHLKALVKYVEQGGVLETHADVPDSVREQLYAEENQRLDKKKKAAENSTTGPVCPPININVLPAGSSQQSIQPPSNNAMPTGTGCTESIIIDGLLDVAVDEYTEWQQSRVSNETFRKNINKARDVTLENCLDLMQIYEDQDPSFFVKHGVKVGAARRFVRDISL
ncbi:uncharacterized protein N7483_002405 [Penicillium malachiteum]|uniref:uncharacterized protein n=1 Tax=Penicillium malachiteum TaxID=1324776 RepID=UPI002546B24B|nr:uncharacterized protein N7483_002405 [Penicillium malachiteum]KAJ5737280.1 hypothetical protein N7483_002405 [Penicillium malachiteum]